MFSLHHTSHYVCSRCLQTTQTKSNRWCKSLMMYNRKGGMEKERSWREKSCLCDWWPSWLQMGKKQRTERVSGKWSIKETILWKTEHGLYTDKSLLNLPGGEEQKTNPPYLWEMCGRYPFSWEGWGKGVWLCATMCAGYAIWLPSPDMTLTFQSSPGGKIQAE